MSEHEDCDLCPEKIVQTYYDSLLGAARKELDNKSEAEDVVQETFLEVLPKLSSGIVDPRAYWSYLYRTLRRKCWARNVQRRKRGVSIYDKEGRVIDVVSESKSPADEVGDSDWWKKFDAALTRLDPIDCKIVQLRHFEEPHFKHLTLKGLTFDAIGVRLERPESTVRCRYRQALNQLRTILAESLKPRVSEEDLPADAVRLGELRGHVIIKFPKPKTGQQPFIRWNGHEVKFKGEDFQDMTFKRAIELLRERGKLPDDSQ